MKLVDGIILNSILLLFPFLIYMVVNVYCRIKDKVLNDLFFEISLFTTIYLLFRHGVELTFLYPMIIFNIPLLIAYLRGKNKTIILLSVVLIYYYHSIGISYLILVIEYVLYYISYMYNFMVKKDKEIFLISSFVFIKGFFVAFKTFSMYRPDVTIFMDIIEIVFTMSVFILITFVSLKLLDKTEKLLDLNKVTSELEKEKSLRNSLFKITHEIKNPIAVCKGYLDMINYSDASNCQKYIEIVRDQINRTLTLMDDFLDYTKVSINKEEVDLYLLVEECCGAIEPLLKKEKVSLSFKVPDDELYLDVDYNRLKQVMVNILKNSIEAIDKRKTNKYISVKVYKNGDKVIIKIKDNGIGMNKKTLEKMGEMFYTTKEKGTGLGVSLSKEIINLHGGSIKYLSQENKYTEVIIKLPLKKEKTNFSFNNKNYCNNKALEQVLVNK